MKMTILGGLKKFPPGGDRGVALIIVLWNALVLHARWDRMVSNRGFAVLAVAGNITTGWSWFGVNELGVGLHSYGFTEGVMQALVLFALSQAIVIGMAMTPVRYWRSSTAIPA